MKLSLAMICKGELENLKRLYPIVKDHIDEWVVVVPPGDSAKEFLKGKAKVIEKDFTVGIEPEIQTKMTHYGVELPTDYRMFKFAEARDESFKHCTGDYTLWLDADDNPVGLEGLRKFVEERGHVDMFDALYDYARDREGNAISDHIRERVIKNNGKYAWRGAALGLIHETVVPLNMTVPTRLEVPKEVFKVVHVPEPGHEDTSTHRNHIALLYEYLKTDGQDARTTYYLGTSFFNMRQYALCIQALLEYVEKSGWDEEKYRAWVRVAEAYHQLGEKPSSRNAYLNAIKELPAYPDAFMGLGESYYSTENYEKAIEFLTMGLEKPVPQTKSAIDMVKYAFRPLIYLALSNVKMGKSTEGYNWFKKAKKTNPKHPWVHKYEDLFTDMRELDEYVRAFIKVGQLANKHYPGTLPALAESIPDEIKDQEVLLDFKRRYAKPKVWSDNSVVIFGSAAFEDWGPESLKSGCGGSEEAVINLSRIWANMGWDVTVFNNCRKEQTLDGVKWVRYERFNPRDDFNILIGWRNNPFLDPKRAAKKLCDVHDVPQNAFYTPESLEDVTLCVKSQYHRSLFPQLEDDNFKIIPNGMDKTQFESKNKKVKNKMVWTSSLDRGLEYLLEVWPVILKEVPDATIDVYYGFQLWDASPYAKTEAGRAWRIKMTKLLDQDRVNFIGRVGSDEIAEAYKEADVFPYPSDFPEISPVHGDTLVETLSGHKKIRDLVGERGFYVYSVDGEGKLSISEVKGVFKTRENTEMIKVGFRPGLGRNANKIKYLTLTPDHEVMLRDGSYKQAGDLEIRESVKAFHRRKNEWGKSYDTIGVTDDVIQPEHRFVADRFYPLPKDWDVDHIDGDTHNNDPTNLEPKTRSQHWVDTWDRKSEKERQEWADSRAKVLADYHASLTQEELTEVKRKAANTRWAKASNHKVHSIEKVENADAYCMEVEPDHNFVANGIVVHNCISLMKAQTAGCIPVSSDYAAIKGTNKYGVQVKGNPQDKGFMTRYTKELVSLLKDEKKKKELRAKMKADWDWEYVAREWDKLFKEQPLKEYPLVSIIIPTYNRPEFVKEAVESAMNQTYPNKEIIVVDDGSEQKPELPGGVAYIHMEHTGKPSVVRNAGIEAAKGEWHFFLDDDDMFYSKNSLKLMMKHEDKGDIIFSNTILHFPNKQTIMEHRFSGLENLKEHFEMPGVYLLKASYSNDVLFNEQMEAGEDYERTVRLVEAGAKPYHVPQPHYLYRHHGSQIQYDKQKEQDKAVKELHENLR